VKRCDPRTESGLACVLALLCDRRGIFDSGWRLASWPSNVLWQQHVNLSPLDDASYLGLSFPFTINTLI